MKSDCDFKQSEDSGLQPETELQKPAAIKLAQVLGGSQRTQQIYK